MPVLGQQPLQYVYDDLGRLSKVVDLTTGQCAAYEYDGVGNIIAISRQSNCVSAPTVSSVVPAGEASCFVATGQNLLGATVSSDIPGVVVSNLKATAASVNFCLSTPQPVCSLSTNVTVRTPGGSSPAFPVTINGASSLLPNVTSSGAIAAAGESDRFCLAVPAPTFAAFQAASTAIQPCIRILDAGGAPVAGAPACNTSATRLDVNLAAGAYFAEISDNGNNNTGAYTVLYQPIVVTTEATDPLATEVGATTGVVTISRTGPTQLPLLVNFAVGGTATLGSLNDYTLNTPLANRVTIPAGQQAVSITVTPRLDAIVEGPETVVLTLAAGDYTIGANNAATVTIVDEPTAVVTIAATDANASEIGIDTGTFTITRAGDTTLALPVGFTRTGTATAGTDYQNTIAASVTIPAGQTSSTLTVTPINDVIFEGPETVILTLTDGANYDLGAQTSATVTIADNSADTGVLVDGATHTGAITIAGQVDRWTFAASAGDRIAVHIGEITDSNGFSPWIRLQAPNGTILSSQFGANAAQIEGIAAPAAGTYAVFVASGDSGSNGLGTYRLTMAHSPGPITVSPGDQGGPLTNGFTHTGEIVTGDLDVWTFDAAAGDRISVHIGEIVDGGNFTPWIRLFAPNGAYLISRFGAAAAQIEGEAAPVSGTYLVLVASGDSGVRGTGTYRLTMTRSSGPITVSPGDQGGPLTNGLMHTGEIVTGDLDVWTFTATAGDRISIHIGEIVDGGDFTPWIRLFAPNGAYMTSRFGAAAAQIEADVAPVTGTYLVLVASGDSGADGVGTYRLTMTHSPGPITVAPGDQGGPLTNGLTHTGEIVTGDLDVWTFDATAGDRISVHIGEIVDGGDFTPWIRLFAPNGTYMSSRFGAAAAEIEADVAPVTGTYLLLVASGDAGADGVGTYRLTMTHSPGPISVSPGDQGGPLTNGLTHTGEIVTGDLDVWTFDATAGDRISVHIGEIIDGGDFAPWIRLFAPNGSYMASRFGAAAAEIEADTAPVTGTYLLLVASGDAGADGAGTYRVTMTHSPGPITVSPGDEGGPLTNGFTHTGEIQRGDLDVWTFTANANDRISIHIGEITDNDDFQPWIRVFGPNGAYLDSRFGTGAAEVEAMLAPLTGTYLVLVASGDAGVDGAGTYRLTMTHTPGPIAVAPGDQGGPVVNGVVQTGEILRGDLDVWTLEATAGDRISVHIDENADAGDFSPWIRLFAPNGNYLISRSGATAADISAQLAPVTGTYLVLVSSADAGVDGAGTYSLTVSVVRP
jgi:hypothetical protein